METPNPLDHSAIAAMRNGCAFIYMGRVRTVDAPAMIDALRSGKLAFAALDVASIEALPSSGPLWDLPNLLVCPHSASTVTTRRV